MSDSEVNYAELAAKRVKKDLRTIMKTPPPGVFAVPDEHDFTKVHCIVLGPEGTPYDKGFFYFFVHFPANYPMSPPHVKFMTTGGGKVRMNPNLYQCGKVCLSILGTWAGPEWSESHTLTSVLISIQSLLGEKPYFNEPGYSTERIPGDSDRYNRIIMHETLRVAVCGVLRNETGLAIPEVLMTQIKKLFLENFTFYEQVALKEYDLTGQKIINPFSFNVTDQKVYKYSEILEALYDIKNSLTAGM